MPVEKSAGVIVFFRDSANEIKYLLIQSSRDSHWSFPKGNIEKGETPEKTAQRELEEEVGLAACFIPGFKETIKFFFKVKFDYQLAKGWQMGDNVMKFVTYFLAEAKGRKIKLSFEHSNYDWFEYKKACDFLLKTDKEVLKKANDFLSKSL